MAVANLWDSCFVFQASSARKILRTGRCGCGFHGGIGGDDAEYIPAEDPVSRADVVEMCDHRLKAEDLGACDGGCSPGDMGQMMAAQGDVVRPTVVLPDDEISVPHENVQACNASLDRLTRADETHTPEVLPGGAISDPAHAVNRMQSRDEPSVRYASDGSLRTLEIVLCEGPLDAGPGGVALLRASIGTEFADIEAFLPYDDSMEEPRVDDQGRSRYAVWDGIQRVPWGQMRLCIATGRSAQCFGQTRTVFNVSTPHGPLLNVNFHQLSHYD